MIIKKAVLLAFSTFLYMNSYSQNDKRIEDSQASYGLKAGINFAELWGEDALPESDRKTGYSIGVFASYKLTKEFKIQPEVIWSLQGEDSKANGRYKISYVNIPVMFKWTKRKLYTEIGPQVGILTVNTSKSVPENLKLDNFETFDFGINAGIGYQVYKDFSIGIRYYEGLTNVAPNADLRNSVLYFGISYTLL